MADTDVPVTAGFRWDGTTSDLAQQLYNRFQKGDSVVPRKYASLPDAITARLAEAGATFDKLPGLLQRALVWDAGYVENGINSSELVRVQTLNGVSMAEIAVSLEAFKAATCEAESCTQPDGLTWYKNKNCNAAPMRSVARCVVDDFKSGVDPHLAMWATGGVDTAIPAMRLLKHSWTDAGVRNEVPAIHTAEAADEPDYLYCSTTQDTARGVGYLVIPCESASTISATLKSKMKDPAPGAIVTAWLKSSTLSPTTAPVNGPTTSPVNAPTTAPNGTTTAAPVNAPTPATAKSTGGVSLTVILVPAIAVVLVAVGVILWCCRRRARSHSDVGQSATRYQQPMPTPSQTHMISLGTRSTDKGLQYSAGAVTRSTGSSETRPSGTPLDENTRIGYFAAVQMLLDDPRLAGKRIPYENVELANQVSVGAYGEVWVGYANREIVAIKRLLWSKYQTPREVEAFAQEIQLSARLHHPNIVRFIGVAWDRPEDLCLVVEFLPAGDLSRTLRETGKQLTWAQHKIGMARALASAIGYLHSQSPAIIHRDLKSKNVLLTNTLEPKIIDFGVSRRKMDETMTAGVGTPFWTAPEVLEGLRYTEKSDIFSFGVLLTELDTCQLPYYDVPNDSGGMVHLKILNEVVAGTLRPSVTESCPEAIRKIVVSCLRQDPATRPTAAEVLWMLA